MLQSPSNGSASDSSRPGIKETDSGEEGRRQTRDRIRAKSFGPQDELRLRRGILRPVTATGER